jgi:ribosomal protein S18 acetylase RimI-like enzyme
MTTGPHVAADEFTASPLTPATWPDLEALFGLPGGGMARGCWCMYYRKEGASPSASAENKTALRELVRDGANPGLIGYLNGAPAGWISLGPRPQYPRLRRSPVMKPVDDTDVWSVVCSYVPAAYRGRGVQRRLLTAAIEFAGSRGAAVLEAYPVDKAGRSQDNSMFFGSRSLYERAGFTEVARRSPTRVVMRLTLCQPR